jgi:hypothetical protein
MASIRARCPRESGHRALRTVAYVEGVDVEFPLNNASSKATILRGQTSAFQVVDSAGATVGTSSGIALTESGSSATAASPRNPTRKITEH